MSRDTTAKAGFTFLETLMVTGMLLSFSMIAMLWMTQVSDVWWTASTQSQLRMTISLVMDRMSQELQRATRRVPPAPTPPGFQCGSLPTLLNNDPRTVVISATQLRLYLPVDTSDTDNNSTIVDANGATEWCPPCVAGVCPTTLIPVDYQLDAPTQELRRVQGAMTQVLARGVTAVAFSAGFPAVTPPGPVIISTGQQAGQQDCAGCTSAALRDNEIRISLTLSGTTPRRRNLTTTTTQIVRLRN